MENSKILYAQKRDFELGSEPITKFLKIRKRELNYGTALGDYRYMRKYENEGPHEDTYYLTFISTQDGSTIGFELDGDNAPVFEISYDTETWEVWDLNPLTIDEGEKLYMRGKNPEGINNEDSASSFVIDGFVDLEGDIAALINYIPPKTVPCTYCLQYLFYGCGGLRRTNNAYISCEVLTDNCYFGMFEGCDILETAPQLPAIVLAENCYAEMFRADELLTTAPELPATNLAMLCYSCMFKGCTSLTVAPELPAIVLAPNCYANMFEGCEGLESAPVLPATVLSASCYNTMFKGCTSLTVAPELPATTLDEFCYASMFKGCTSLTTAPELPAETLVTYCYNSMFSECEYIDTIKCHAKDISASLCTTNWLSGVANAGEFYGYEEAEWTTGANGVPTGWTFNEL